MGLILGTDEAGYGPNLGPLVIAATLWRVPGDPLAFDLSAALAPTVSSDPTVAGQPDGPLVFADSKQLYQSGGSTRLLERGLWAAAGVLGVTPGNVSALWQRLAPEAAAQAKQLADYPGLSDDQSPSHQQTLKDVTGLQTALTKASVELLDIRALLIFPRELNQLMAETGTKGGCLSAATVQLIAQMLTEAPKPATEDPAGETVLIVCDKHGGRNKYQAILQRQFPDPLIQIRAEARVLSEYWWQDGSRNFIARFGVGADRLMPPALASMAAKTFRQRCMQALNDFWASHVPGLKPTAGYPADAKRFFAEIDEARQKLGIPVEDIWRNR